MSIPRLLHYSILVFICTLLIDDVCAQTIVKGTVYDRSQQYPMQGVSVQTTSGQRVKSDSLGHYLIRLKESDSIFFSYLGKLTYKFPVKTIEDPNQFDMSIDVASDALPTVTVWPKNYYQDSIENRLEYDKVFNYGGAQYIDNMKTNRRGGVGVGLDLGMFFNRRQQRAMEDLQRMLIEEEREKYVDHRFTKKLVKQITGMQSPALDTFMRVYRPSYDFIKSFETDWEYYQYIQSMGRNFIEIWKEDHPGLPASNLKTTNADNQ